MEYKEKLIKKKEERIDTLCEINRTACWENSLDVSEELRLVQEFNEDKPRMSKVIQMNKPLENYIIYEEETVEYLNIGSNKSVQVYYREDIFIEGKEIRQTSDLELYEILPRENFLDGDDDWNISYEFKFLMLESKDPEKKKKSTMNKCYKWYRKRFTYPVCA